MAETAAAVTCELHATNMNTGILYNTSQTYARVYEFTTTAKPITAQGSAGSYIWLPPSDCTFLELLLIGGGGGGGGGARRALGVLRRGGGGGGAAAITWVVCSRTFFNAPLSITVGSGGAGGAAGTVDSTDVIVGTAGTDSVISMAGVQVLFAAAGNGAQTGGVGGLGGSSTGGTIQGTQGQSSTSTATAQSNTIVQTGIPVAPSGGSATAANQYTNGPSISPHGGPFFYDRRYQGVLGASATYAGGGNCAAGVAGTSGAHGLFYGSGGCGGGASDNGFASGAGGNGDAGYVRIICF